MNLRSASQNTCLHGSASKNACIFGTFTCLLTTFRVKFCVFFSRVFSNFCHVVCSVNFNLFSRHPNTVCWSVPDCLSWIIEVFSFRDFSRSVVFCFFQTVDHAGIRSVFGEHFKRCTLRVACQSPPGDQRNTP